MKRDHFVKKLLIVLMGVSLICFGLIRYENGVDEFSQRAIDAFYKALEIELANKNIEKGALMVQSRIDISKIGQTPQIVGITRATGREEYKVSVEQHQKNVAKDTDTRMLHSFVLERNPIVVDSLNAIWQQILKDSYLIGKTALRMSITNGCGHTITFMTTDSNSFDSAIPLFNCYLGYGCEIELVGFFNYSCWFILGRYVIMYALLILVICIIVYFFVSYMFKRFYQKVIVTQLVRDMPKGTIRIYQLKENVIFDAEKRLLIIDGQVKVELPLQRCALLEMLLNAEEYKLSDEVLMEQLWPDHSGTAVRLQQAVKRLRHDLATADLSIHLRRVQPYSYQLFI